MLHGTICSASFCKPLSRLPDVNSHLFCCLDTLSAVTGFSFLFRFGDNFDSLTLPPSLLRPITARKAGCGFGQWITGELSRKHGWQITTTLVKRVSRLEFFFSFFPFSFYLFHCVVLGYFAFRFAFSVLSLSKPPVPSPFDAPSHPLVSR